MKEKSLDKLKEDLKQINVKDNINHFINNYRHNIEKSNYKNKYNFINSISPKSSKDINVNKEKQLFFKFCSELEELENFFVKQFMQETKDKSDKKIKMIIPQKNLDYENRIKLLLTKAKNEVIYYHNQLKNAEKRNIELKNNLIMINKQKNRLYEDLKEADLSIEKINKKFELFTQLRPYFESLINEFNIDDDEENKKKENKYNLERNIKYRKYYENELGKELEEKKESLLKMKNKAKNEEIYNKNINEKLYNYFVELEKNDKIEENEYKKKLLNIKEDVNNKKMIQKENDLILNIFFSLYNLLYKKLNLQRDLIKEPKNIDLIKTDYTPLSYRTEEMYNYINLMLKNSTDESCGLLLREIVSYANMMLREENAEFNKMKYDPIKTVNEIENYILKVQDENILLKNEIENIQKGNKIENEYINKLNGQVKHINNMIDILNKTMKTLYIKDNKKGKIIKKCLSANNINCYSEDNDSKLSRKESKTLRYLRKYNEGKKNKKIEFIQGTDNLIDHINRLFFYKEQCDIKPKDYYNVHENAYKRIKKKLYKLKKIQENKNKYTTVENAISSNINENIEKLIYKIHQELPKEN